MGNETMQPEEKIGKVGSNSKSKIECFRMQDELLDGWLRLSNHDRNTPSNTLQQLHGSSVIVHSHELIEIN